MIAFDDTIINTLIINNIIINEQQSDYQYHKYHQQYHRNQHQQWVNVFKSPVISSAWSPGMNNNHFLINGQSMSTILILRSLMCERGTECGTGMNRQCRTTNVNEKSNATTNERNRSPTWATYQRRGQIVNNVIGREANVGWSTTTSREQQYYQYWAINIININ